MVCGVLIVSVFALTALPQARRRGPVGVLRAGLRHYYRDAPHEPIDDRANLDRMERAVREIRQRGLHQAAEVLLEVWLFYDATDNSASAEAREALVDFGPCALPAVRACLQACQQERFRASFDPLPQDARFNAQMISLLRVLETEIGG
jgi:hypothetical protein